MPASQTGFGNFFLERNISMPTGYQIPMLGSVHQQQAQHLAAMAAGIPLGYSGLQAYNFIPYPHHRHIAHMTNGFDLKASPYHHALLARGGPFYPPYRGPGAAEDPGRVPKVATRESTGALKAWLNEHLKNPYPTKGEKIMLAIITKMSLTQVSTWFANARRRLKKENRVSWACKGKSDEEDEEQEGESDEEDGPLEKCPLEKCPLEKCPLDERDEEETQSERADTEERVHGALECSAPVHARLEVPSPQRRLHEDREHELVKKVERRDSDLTPSGLGSKDNVSSQKPKIWSLAETATSETVKKPVERIHHPAGKLWADWASRTGLLVPACYSTREIL